MSTIPHIMQSYSAAESVPLSDQQTHKRLAWLASQYDIIRSMRARISSAEGASLIFGPAPPVNFLEAIGNLLPSDAQALDSALFLEDRSSTPSMDESPAPEDPYALGSTMARQTRLFEAVNYLDRRFRKLTIPLETFPSLRDQNAQDTQTAQSQNRSRQLMSFEQFQAAAQLDDAFVDNIRAISVALPEGATWTDTRIQEVDVFVSEALGMTVLAGLLKKAWVTNESKRGLHLENLSQVEYPMAEMYDSYWTAAFSIGVERLKQAQPSELARLSLAKLSQVIYSPDRQRKREADTARSLHAMLSHGGGNFDYAHVPLKQWDDLFTSVSGYYQYSPATNSSIPANAIQAPTSMAVHATYGTVPSTYGAGPSTYSVGASTSSAASRDRRTIATTSLGGALGETDVWTSLYGGVKHEDET